MLCFAAMQRVFFCAMQTACTPPQGTMVTSGRARGVVVGTGEATAIGQIRGAMKQVRAGGGGGRGWWQARGA